MAVSPETLAHEVLGLMWARSLKWWPVLACMVALAVSFNQVGGLWPARSIYYLLTLPLLVYLGVRARSIVPGVGIYIPGEQGGEPRREAGTAGWIALACLAYGAIVFGAALWAPRVGGELSSAMGILLLIAIPVSFIGVVALIAWICCWAGLLLSRR